MEEYTTKTVQHGPCTIIIQRPVLTNAEQAKREKALQKNLENVMREYIRRKEQKNEKAH